MGYKNIILDEKDGILTITINRPKVLNALNTDTLNELENVVRDIERDKEIMVVIITGSGEKSFVAGADIAEMKSLNIHEGRNMTRLGQCVFQEIENLSRPVIAAVNGYALGGGCELAMACDIRIASEKAKFGQPEVGLGIIPGYGGTQRLPRLIGKGRAKYYIFTTDMITAEEAFNMGLIDKVVPHGKLYEETLKIAEKIISKGPIAVRMAKYAVNNGMNMDLASGIAYEAEAYTTSFGSEDRIEGMSAFLEKRKADFKDE
ncbi:crotonase [Acidilutibacter cellobiosedens]|jgi:enoyl-CoA hydratase|uniref:Crotonase n=1 Tax=Acidilutibacter cellobiosedens TaxID=2507161 RepID=A0A410QB21_9FIRM|nr:enoyl-CoA hydratase-related protein [Acidilutibacter cellobiosedens]QAT61074.1 crotonase [Acidilutibacter cellobiosedens]